MADEHVWMAHRCGYAVHLGKELGNSWGFHADGLKALAIWLQEKNPAGFWDFWQHENPAPWILLHERDFKKTWTTPSGYMFCKDDYLGGSLAGKIFRVELLANEKGASDL